MTYTRKNKGVCSLSTTVEVENGVVKKADVIGGCSGNLQGVCRLIEGMDAREAIEKLKGIRCGFKNTSCPDQISKALEEALEAEK